MPLILGTNSIKDTGYDVDNSCRFDDGSNCQMRRSGVDGGDQDKFTLSMWIKRGAISTSFPRLFTSRADANDRFEIYFGSNDSLYIEGVDNGSTTLNLNTNRKFRDPSAWFHFLLAVDTDQGTASNRAKLYINGVQETSFATETYPSQDGNIGINTSSFPIQIGEEAGNGVDFDGYLTEIVFLDGVQKTNTDFGEFDEDSGIWKPIDVSGLSSEKGNNGFYLDFEDSSNLGNDVFGGTDFTVSNLTAIDQTTDTCTNNFATMNPLDVHPGGTYTFSDGNLTVEQDISRGTLSTFGLSSGKWYAEAKFISTSGSDCIIGVVGINTTANEDPGIQATGYMYNQDGTKKNNNSSSSYGNTYTTGDIVGIALDLDNNKIYFSKNGTFQNSGDPTSGSSGTGSAFTLTDPASTPTGFYFFAHADELSTNKVSWNYGSAPYSISSGNTDGNGYGNFEYAVPSGYYALNSKNLAEYG